MKIHIAIHVFVLTIAQISAKEERVWESNPMSKYAILLQSIMRNFLEHLWCYTLLKIP